MSGEVPTVVTALGALAGTFGVVLAVHFQLISRKDVPPRYVLAFFAYGATTLLFHGRVFTASDAVVAGLTVLGAAIALGVELLAALYVYRVTRDRAPLVDYEWAEDSPSE